MSATAENMGIAAGNSAQELVSGIVAANDPYAALGCYAHVDSAARTLLEPVILASARLRLFVAAAPDAPADLLDRLTFEADPSLALRLAKNPATPAVALDRLLGRNPDERSRRYIAAHPKANAAILGCCSNQRTHSRVRTILSRATSRA